jgi:hypothetical protein
VVYDQDASSGRDAVREAAETQLNLSSSWFRRIRRQLGTI